MAGMTLGGYFKDRLLEHETMRNHTLLQCGGVADFFVSVESIKEVIDCLEIAQADKIPVLVLGEGNNIIFSDYGFPGLVIANNTNNISYILDKSQVIVDSGVRNMGLLLQSANRNLGGIEFLPNCWNCGWSGLYKQSNRQ